MRELATLEFFGGGPLDGRTVSTDKHEVTVLDGDTLYVYRRQNDDDGSIFFLLERVVSVPA